MGEGEDPAMAAAVETVLLQTFYAVVFSLSFTTQLKFSFPFIISPRCHCTFLSGFLFYSAFISHTLVPSPFSVWWFSHIIWECSCGSFLPFFTSKLNVILKIPSDPPLSRNTWWVLRNISVVTMNLILRTSTVDKHVRELVLSVHSMAGQTLTPRQCTELLTVAIKPQIPIFMLLCGTEKQKQMLLLEVFIVFPSACTYCFPFSTDSAKWDFLRGIWGMTSKLLHGAD